MSGPIAGNVPHLRDDECQVWWATLAHRAPWQADLFDQAERRRLGRYLRPADRDRFTVGVALTRLVLGAQLGIPPDRVPIDRRCARCGGAHGRPQLAEAAELDFSLSHSGAVIVLAVARSRAGDRGPRAVGIDVELVAPAVADEAPVDIVLSQAEQIAFSRLDAAAQPEAFFRYWVRKEAVLKATGDGLAVPMTRLTVSGPDQPPRLAAWKGRPSFPRMVALHDLHAEPGYAAALAIVGLDCAVSSHDASRLVGIPAAR